MFDVWPPSLPVPQKAFGEGNAEGFVAESVGGRGGVAPFAVAPAAVAAVAAVVLS